MIPTHDEYPTATCPRCKILHVDYDGFGVLYCEYCRYCAHPSITDGMCDLCLCLQSTSTVKDDP